VSNAILFGSITLAVAGAAAFIYLLRRR